MTLITLIFVAVGLAMDAFAVSVMIGSVYRKPGHGHALSAAAAFGLFQALMPVMGWLLGIAFLSYISGWDHWIAFGLLAGIGLKMIYESFKIRKSEDEGVEFSFRYLMALAVATSIDALAVGVTFSVLATESILFEVAVIGAITFALSYAGVMIGKMFGHFCESRMETIGGLVLVSIGVKILLEHTCF